MMYLCNLVAKLMTFVEQTKILGKKNTYFYFFCEGEGKKHLPSPYFVMSTCQKLHHTTHSRCASHGHGRFLYRLVH